MAITSNTYTGNGTNKLFSITFPYLDTTDIDVYLNGVLQTVTTQYTFANATTVEFVTAPAGGVSVLLDRSTDDTTLQATFFPGSSIKAADLNYNFDQVLYLAQETAVIAQNQSTAGLQDQITAANNTANNAITIATGAETTANGIAGTANTALSNSSAAVSTANAASVTATNAETTANAISAVANAALPKAGGTMTGNLNVPSINGGPIAGSRNRIINGNFDVWQRGTSTGTWIAPITNYYWADRWVVNSSGSGGNGLLSQQAFTVGQTAVPGEPTYFQRWQITAAATGQTTGNCWVEQRIEDVRTLAGQTATVSFYAQGTGTLPNIYLSQTFGTGGSTQVSYTLASNVALNASWTKYTYTVNLSSISGKTIGTNHYVNLTFMVPINATYTFDLAQVQVEPGPTATPFERRSIGQELALCQRYYEVFGQYLIYSGYAGSGNVYYNPNRFAVTKRAVPNVVTTDVANSSAFPAGNPTVGAVSADGFYVEKTAIATASVSYFQYSATASAEL
jgi:hypothetical protein